MSEAERIYHRRYVNPVCRQAPPSSIHAWRYKRACCLEVIERNARAQSNLIADLLDISRIVAGKLRLEPRAFNFVACLESAINNVRPLATEKAVQVVNSVHSAILPRIAMYGDPVRVEQVLLNVLVNAIKFTPPSGRI
jgi:signal transduction histidine kinase